MDDAVPALGTRPKTVFLTQGRLQLGVFTQAPQHRYVVRTIDRPAEIDALPKCKLILARGPFSIADELALMKRERIEALVTKNSGGDATYAKIEAARALEIEVVIVRRPPAPEAETHHDLDAVLAWIADHRRTP
jgi:precorrin-6A/cobalt-precorrin-6A reductase